MTLPPEMTLRDWFAGQVLSRAIDLAADVNHTEMRARFGDDYLATSKVSIAAAMAYSLADEMLERRAYLDREHAS